jgi:predicted transposase/invertase (TIGR01784 family)
VKPLKTDSIFYRIFQTAPGIFFELLGESAELGQNYVFRSVEVKQLAFRLDGVFLPQPDAPDQTVWFVEVQFQKDSFFYHRFFAEIFLFFDQYPQTVDWKAVVLFAKRSVEPCQTQLFRTLLDSKQVQRVYLEDLQDISTDSLGVGLLQLIGATPETAGVQAQALVKQARCQVQPQATLQRIIELIETVMVYKFPTLSREDIEQMFSLSELKQTRVYQEALEEGRQEGRQEALEEGRQEGRRNEALAIMLRLLSRRLGSLDPMLEEQIQELSLAQLEALGDGLLEFTNVSDLQDWLQN